MGSQELAAIKRRLATLTGANPNQLLLPMWFVKCLRDPAHVERLTDSQLYRLLIWMMPLYYTAYMSELNQYYRGLTEGPDAKLSRLDHLIEAQDMYRVCRAIANERKVVRLAALKDAA